MTDTNDVDQNVRVSFQLSREAAIRLRELALTKRDLLCKLGVLAVKLGNESQICVTSGRPEFEKRTHRTNLEVSREYGREKYNRYGDAKKISKLNSTAGKRDFTISAKEMVSVCPALAKATADSVIISEDALPSVSLLNKESFMRGEGSSSLYERFDARRSDDSTREYYGSVNEDPLSVKSILKAKNGLKANTIDKNKQAREMPSINTTNSSELYTKTTLKANNVTLGNMVGKTNSTISNEEFSKADEVRDNILMENMDTSRKNITRGQVTCHDMTTGILKEDCGETDIFDNEEDIVKRDDEILCKGKNDLSIDSSSINEEDNLSNMTDSFDCSTNNEFGSLPCHGISFAQHLINLSKQYRLENEKCGDKFFEASKIVKNDHVLRSFTTGNDKQEDFMGLPGQNSLLFGDNFSASTVKSAEELSKEHSEASPTNLDTMSEASADSYHSLFEDAHLGSVHELRYFRIFRNFLYSHAICF